MALEQITFNLGALEDSANSGKNYVAGQVFEVFNIDDTYASIFADSAGTIPIDQSGIQNISNSDGECKFFIDKGFYNIKSGGKARQLNANFRFEFETVADAVNAKFISLLEGRRVFIVDRGAHFNVVLTSSVTPNSANIIQSSSNPMYSFELENKDFADLIQYGAIDGEVSNNAILAAFSSGLDVRVSNGSFKKTVKIDIERDSDFRIYGNGELIDESTDIPIRIVNPSKLNTTLNGPTNEDNVFDVNDTTGVQVGDVMIITSVKQWDASRPAYVAGEIFTVHEVLASQIVTDQNPKDTYFNLDQVSFHRPSKVKIDDVKFTGSKTGSVILGQEFLVLENQRGTEIYGAEVKDANKAGIKMIKNTAATINGVICTSETLFPDFAYGLNLNSCSDITVTGGSYITGRHGIAHGGTIPCRNTRFIGVEVGSHIDSSEPSFDCHANTENTYLYGCHILEGMAINGRNFSAESCNIDGALNIYTNPNDYHKNEYIRFDNCEISKVGTIDRELVRIKPLNDASGTSQYIGQIVFTGGKIKLSQESGDFNLVRGVNDFASTPVQIDLIKFSNVEFEFDHDGVNDVYAFLFDENQIFHVDKFVVDDDCKINTNNRLALFENVDRIIFKDSDISSSDDSGFLWQNTTKPASYFEVAGNKIQRDNNNFRGSINADVVSIHHNELENVSSAIINLSSAGEVELSNNIGWTSAPEHECPKTYFIKQENNVISYGTAAPTAGAWQRGDRVINPNMSVGNVTERICTVSGTPGTWVDGYTL